MDLPEFTRRLVESKLSSYCENRVPLTVRDKVRLVFKIRGNLVTLFEQRPSFQDKSIWLDLPVAQFRFNPANSYWTLYCRDRNSKWFEFLPVRPTKNFDKLVDEVEKDTTHIFWG
jgi:hypothetical protein